MYESRRALTTHSLVEQAYFDLIQENKIKNKEWKEKAKQKREIQKMIYYLRKASYIKFEKDNKIKLSSKGTIKNIIFRSRRIKARKRAKHYYVVIFDIPESMRRIRDLFRKVLYNFGSDKLQKSVFMVESEEGHQMIKELIKESKMFKYVRILKCIKN